MFENNNNTEKLKQEINELVDNVEKIQDEIDVYCELMKKMFLSTSNLN